VKNTRPNKPAVFFLTCILVVAFLTSPHVYAVIFQQQSHTVTQTIRNTNWLYGWTKRVKLTINHSDIDSDLSNFPVLVYLSNASGQADDDVSFVFDELQSDANRQKIAVTTSNGTTQCYVEIERWNTATEQAWLWVKVPNISSTTDTEFYLYYDRDNGNNTAYIGDVNTLPTESVWDADFLGVYHFEQAPNGTIYDSTNNSVDLGSFGSMSASDLVTGVIGNAIRFDGSNDRLDSLSQITFEDFTFEAWGRADTWSNWRTILAPDGDARDFCTNAGALTFWDSVEYTIGPILSGTDWKYLVTRYNDTASVDRLRGFVDGSLTSQTANPSYASISAVVRVAACLYGGSYVDFWDGKLDEIRVSKTARSEAWIKASYESGRDNLLSFGSEEIGASWGDYSAELLANPGAEAGTTTGWTATGPHAANFAAGYDCPAGSAGPHTGSYAFYWNNPSSSSDWAYQEIDLAPWLSDVQAGDAQIKAKGWLVCSEYHVPPWDLVRMRVVFYDGASQEISADTYDTGARGDVQTWTEFGMENYPIPATAVTVRIYFQTYEINWDAGNADDFTVQIRTYG